VVRICRSIAAKAVAFGEALQTDFREIREADSEEREGIGDRTGEIWGTDAFRWDRESYGARRYRGKLWPFWERS
jgi:hypothetical protein